MKRNINAVGSHTVFIVLSLITTIPLLFLVIISFTDRMSILDFGYSFLPKGWSAEAYEYVFKPGSTIFKSYGVTLFVTVVGTCLSVLITTMIAYVLSRNYRYKKPLSLFVFIPMLFSAGLIPTYIVYTQYYGLKDNLLVCILPYLVNCWNIVLLRTFLQDIPHEVIESAQLDGASELTTLLRIVAPMAKPGIVTIALLTMLSFWNQWTPSMIYITSQGKQTLQYYLYRLIQDSSLLKQEMDAMGLSTLNLPTETVKYAAAVIVMGPTLLVFPFFQKHFVRGISTGSVKG